MTAVRRPGGVPLAGAAAAACLLALASLLATGLPFSGTPGGESPLEASIAEAPLAFEPNAGRTDGDVEFLAHSVAGGSLYLTSDEAVLSLPQGKDDPRALRLGFPGAELSGLEELPGKANSFIGDDPSKWQSGIPTYGRVRYEGIYPGVDLDFYGNQQDLEYDFRLAPRADPSRIGVEMDGADKLRLTPSGDLVVEVGKATVRQQAPVAYQEIDGERRSVPSAYDLNGPTVGFRLGAYDRSRPLVIDPLVLAYSTYLGGGAADNGQGIAVDSAGAAYIVGSTDSGVTTLPIFPIQDEFRPDQALQDAFVTKFNPDSGGTLSLAYSTYLGDSQGDVGSAIAVDSAGAAYVAGRTDSAGFPTKDPIPGEADAGGTDAFVTKLNPDSGGAVTLDYSSYLSGGANDSGVEIAVDETRAAYVAGLTESTDFPVLEQFQGDQGGLDGFVTKLNPHAGGAATLAYSTYLGGGGSDAASGIAVDVMGAAYVTGVTGSTGATGFPTQDPFQPDEAADDAFVAKLDPASEGAVTLAYSTHLGGGNFDAGSGIAVDGSGAAYVTGATFSTDFPVQDSLQSDQGADDGFVTKVNPDSGGATTLAYSTYLGGSATDQAFAIAVDSARAAYVTGITDSANFPTRDRFQADQAGRDAFVTKLNPDSGGAASLGYSTYLGGGGIDSGNAIAADGNGAAAYVTGNTESLNFPTQDRFQADQAGSDAFVTKFAVPRPPGGGGNGGDGADTDPPETTIDKGPKRKTKKRKAKFAFSSDEPGSTFFCKLDKKAFAPCDASERFKVKPKKHKLQVQAVDSAGNTDPTPAQRKWKVKKKGKRR